MNAVEHQNYFLYPSTLFVADTPYWVSTVLSTCVAVFLWDEENKVGGVNHFMLPQWNVRELPTPKYGNIAMERLLEKMIASGASKKNLVAKVFGGKEDEKIHPHSLMIGRRNTEVAMNFLEEQSIPVVASNVGGTFSRKLSIDTGKGLVYMKRI